MAVIEDVWALGGALERSYQVRLRARLKFRVGQMVYVAFSRRKCDGLRLPKGGALIGGDPRKFQMPSASDLRFNWVYADLALLDPTEARELVVDAWRMVIPKKVSRAYDLTRPNGPG